MLSIPADVVLRMVALVSNIATGDAFPDADFMRKLEAQSIIRCIESIEAEETE